ncbi:D-2-hydroxyacid dehydrogenase family protein [Streptomyces sp. A7024]|uniref:D-2-hydroxyacid dehydrogenase family protein n=1 Tax=Streptomyces coryli TaxID=1128680 RepID=A0A6G4U4B3_9ACTN|nr:D-2-hydroxyacid dehydrogenase family protein [Streptomyces coryli]NGN66580.1 D-2-hydroxyacid dehydrogenase family protein [Streptomyces coryli]
MKLRCAILDDFQGVALGMADWDRLRDRVEVRAVREHLGGEDAVVAEIADCDIVVIMRERTPFPASLLTRLPKLKLLITSGMRNASVDREAAALEGVTVCGTASSPAPPTELTWALLLGLARHVVPEANALRTGGPWQSTIGADLHGARLGLLGLGKIGGRMAAIGRAFGMEVAAWSQNLTAERAAEVGASPAGSLDELLRTSDFVSVHTQLSDRTRGLIGERELALMKPTAYLVNTSRAAIVDQRALIDALHRGRIAGAGVDVYEHEPLPADDPLRTAPNLLGLPHLGYVTRGNYAERFFPQAVEDIEAYLKGAPVRVL